jgi:hydroxyacylglutathione hydrolase
MLVRPIHDDSLAQMAYLVGCQRTGEAIIIDPQRDVDRYLAAAAKEKLRLVAATETHIHADFVSGCRELAQRGLRIFLSDMGGADWTYRWAAGLSNHVPLHHRERFSIGRIDFEAMHTPGHTPEHLSFLITDRGGGADAPMAIATGDFVFVGDLGRPDLLETAAGIAGVKETSAAQLAESAAWFLTLPDYLQVWPGHGAGSACGKALGAVPQTTVGYERRFNPAVRLAGDSGAFIRGILEGQPEPPLYFGRMKALNRDGPPLLTWNADGTLPLPRKLAESQITALNGRAADILDTRPWAHFRKGHLPGALHTPLDSSFAAVAGSYVRPGTPVYLIVEEARLDAAVRVLLRVGIDEVCGFIAPEPLAKCPCSSTCLESIPEIDVAALRQQMARGGAFILDVRAAAEHAEAAIPGSVNLTHTRLPAGLDRIPRGRPVLVHCRAGGRSAIASALLQREGYQPINIAGGMLAWEKAGYPTVHPTPGPAPGRVPTPCAASCATPVHAAAGLKP